MTFRTTAILVLAVCTFALPASAGPEDGVEDTLDSVAARYVRLVLAVGQHDAAYVDAFYGPEEWRTAAEAAGKRPLQDLEDEANALLDEIAEVPAPHGEMLLLRYQYLRRQLEALLAYVEILGGEKMTFDQESKALYDAVAPKNSKAYFESSLSDLEALLPGEGALSERVEEFREQFVIPKDKLDPVFRAAIEEGKRRTAQYIELPEDERFVLEYVTDKPWSGYNWYKGGNYSLIQINTDLPIYISRAVDLASHEGYPGHHLYNALLEQHLVRERGWVEYSVYALFSPQSLIAEGSANYGIDMAFPGEERVAFERDVLFPLAGIDPAKAEKYYEVQAVLDRLNYAGNEAARGYLDGKMTREEAVDWLVKYALMSPARADQRVDFIDTYRTYVINYNLGKDLVREYIEAEAGGGAGAGKRWSTFSALISSPRLPSGLR